VAALRRMARAGAAAGSADGQHVALLQLQRRKSPSALQAAALDPAWRLYLRHVELLTAPDARHVGRLRGQRHPHPHRRNFPAAVPPPPSAACPGATHWLITAL